MRSLARHSAIPPAVLEATAELEQPTDSAPPVRPRRSPPAPRAPSADKSKTVEREVSPYPPPESLPPVPTEPAPVTAPPPSPPPRAPLVREQRHAEPAPSPTVPRSRGGKREGWSDVDIAYGIAGGGLFVAAGAATWSVDDPDPGVLAVGGVGLGIAVVGLTTAGVLTLVQDDEEQARVTVQATGSGASMTIAY